VVALELPRAGRRELEPRGHVAVPELPQAGRRVPEPRGHAAVLELPQAWRWELEPWGTRPRAPALSSVLTLSLYVGYSVLRVPTYPIVHALPQNCKLNNYMYCIHS
jgi:hypothetical protein